MKEELLEDVPARLKVRERLCGFEAMASSESSDSEEFEDLGGDSSSVGIWRATRS